MASYKLYAQEKSDITNPSILWESSLNVQKIISFVVVFAYISMPHLCLANQPAIQVQHSDGSWHKEYYYYALKGETIGLKIEREDVLSIRWFQIIPDTSQDYKNANHPWEPNPYQWVGFGEIQYQRVEITQFYNQPEVQISSAVLKDPTPEISPFYHHDLGSFWFDVELTLTDGSVVKTAGLEKNDNRGLSPKVFRISYVTDNAYLGYLTSFFNVPGLFGSVPYQSKNYIGADCADVLMAANAILTKTKLEDFNVARLVKTFPRHAKLNVSNGQPDKELRWGEDVHPGDFIAVRYSPRQQYAHIGALYKDENQNGLLDKEDGVLHAGPQALHYSQLKEGGFDGEVVILSNH